MKKLYFVSNNSVSRVNIIYPKSTTFNEVREKTMLSKKGVEKAISLVTLKNLEKVDAIYSSSYFCALETSKFIAEEKELDIKIDSRLNERIVGELGCNEYRFLKGMQEHDFNYKLPNGESIHEVRKRMNEFLEEILLSEDENIVIVTHNIALLSLALKWCNKGFNLEDRLILDYDEEVIFDGVFHEIDLIEVTYDENKFLEIKRLI